jgi:hypothetical protein
MITPHVSVVMPVLNGERYVADAIESVLAQSFQSFEFVVIDDGSTDRSGQIVAHYAKRDDRIKAFPQPHRGIVDSLNTGIAWTPTTSACLGDYNCRLITSLATQTASRLAVEHCKSMRTAPRFGRFISRVPRARSNTIFSTVGWTFYPTPEA